jgi:nicotinamide phosphoribosyltransferase
MTDDILSNILLDVDSYKASHAYAYPPGTERVFSYIESRGGAFERAVFFGLQMYLKRYLSTRVTSQMVDQAALFWQAHGEPFYREGWDYIVEQHGGRLPVVIKAAPEGTVLPTKHALVTVENTDPKCFWLTSFLETALLRAVWYPTTVATTSYHAKQLIRRALVQSSDDPAGQLPFKLHDFGARGVSSKESAGIGGAAHLVNFMGSDTVTGVLYANHYYNIAMSGFSIPAAEHSTVTSWGRSREADAYANMIQQFGKPGALVAVVSDSYDIMNAVREIWGNQLKQLVLDSGATLVVRPDSGDPLTMPIDVIDALGERFGYTVNSKGYRVLPSSVRVIQGDGITIDTLPKILDNLLHRGWSADNLAFGMGGGLLQQVNRDTQRFAMKASAIAFANGEWHDVYKDPVTDPGKQSKRGRVMLWEDGGEYETAVRRPTRWTDRGGTGWREVLVPVWQDGELLVDTTFDEVRQRTG